MAHKLGPGIISGVVSEDGVPKAGGIVTLYDRDNGAEVIRVKCDDAGAYTISGLNPDTDSYYVVAQDDDGATRKNALVQDYVQPINGAVGSSFSANWYLEMKKQSPMFAVVGLPRNSTGQFISPWISSGATDQTHGAQIDSGSVTTSSAGLLGAPDLQLITMSSAIIRAYGASEWCSVRNSQSVNSTAAGSMFIILDTASPAVHFMMCVDSSDRIKHFAVHYSSFIISVTMTTAGVASVTLVSYTIPVGSGRSGLHSVACSVDTSAGGACKIFFDGVEVASSPSSSDRFSYGWLQTTNFNEAIYGGLIISGATSGATYDVNNTTSGRFVIAWSSLLEMTASTALVLHNSFFTAQPPVVTGFVKEILMDYPTIHYPMSSAGQILISDPHWTGYGSAKSPHSPTTSTTLWPGPYANLPQIPAVSPVLGTSATTFNGSTVFTSSLFDASLGWFPCGLARWQLTMECWVNLTQLPSTSGDIINFKTISTNANNLTLFVTTSRTLSIFLRSTVNDTVSFTPVLPIDTWHHVVVTVDRNIGESKLYLNGVLVDTKPTGLTAITTSGNGNGMLSIGGDVNLTNRRLVDGLVGELYGITMYQTILTAVRVQAHYDSRLIA